MTAPLKTRGAVLTSSGSGDAGRVPLLGPDGKLDPSFFQAFGASETGSAVALTGGAHVSQIAVNFTPGRFVTAPFVAIMPTFLNATLSNGFLAAWSIPLCDTAGFTVKFDLNEASGGFTIIDLPFRWLALSI